MTNITTSYKNADVRGVPTFEVMDTMIDANLVAGAEPGIQEPVRILLDDSLTLAQFTVVGITAAGKLTPAVYNATPASGIKAIGVLAHGATSGASNTTKYGEVFLKGCYNVGDDDAGAGSPLIWDSSFDTAAKKTAWPPHVGNPNLIFRKRLVTA